jgi:glycosyltransferase involved in cell wall biosynthesis
MLSVAIITLNEEANIARTLRSVAGIAGEIVIVDSGSTDRTLEVARAFGGNVKVFSEPWRGFAGQKNFAIERCTGDWVLSLDADEELSPELASELSRLEASLAAWEREGFPVNEDDDSQQLQSDGLYWGVDHAVKAGKRMAAFCVPRVNMFLGRPIRHGGFYPDRKVRLCRRELGRFEERPVHETMRVEGPIGTLRHPLIHHAYPTLFSYLEHMNRYSSLGGELAASKGKTSGSLLAFWFNVLVRPRVQFVYNYFFRLGFLDGREGFLLHWYHQTYASWKYAKAWELGKRAKP